MNKKPPLDLSKKHIFLALDDHTDYMWTADEDTYRQAFLEMLDYYIEKAAETAGEPSEFQSRFNTDGTLWVWEYEKNRSPEQFARLVEAIRSGHISVPLNPIIVTYGGAPLEAILRGMFYAGKLERRHELRFSLALAMENQTMPYVLGMVWAGSGAK
ncbi:MAG: glycoside hydrolase, partial [Chloroflexi bacterium]